MDYSTLSNIILEKNENQFTEEGKFEISYTFF